MPEAYWRAALGTDPEGTYLSDAASGLTEQGINAIYQREMTMEELAAATVVNPAIASGGGQALHALVVDAIEEGQVLIRDPLPEGLGRAYSLPLEQFAQWWSGNAVIVP